MCGCTYTDEELDEMPHEWREFAEQHKSSDSKNLNHRSFGNDEKLEQMLDAIGDEKHLTSEQLENLSRNRTAKHRRRHKNLMERAESIQQYHEANPLDDLIEEETIDQVKSQLSKDEWDLLWEIRAAGRTYAEVAENFDLKVGTLKSIICRCESRLRDQFCVSMAA